MASRPGLTWTSDTLTRAFRDAPKAADQYLTRTTSYYSARSETYAKTRAKWTDRSGNARSGLTSEASTEGSRGGGKTYTIDIFHTMPYGIWLEVRFGGKYAIIKRTVDYNGKRFFDAANTIMARMFGGS